MKTEECQGHINGMLWNGGLYVLEVKEENHLIDLILMVFHRLYSFFFLNAHSTPPLFPFSPLCCLILE